MPHVKRRDFIALLGGAVALPFTASAQVGERPRRIGALMPEPENDSESATWVAAFEQSLAKLGWLVGRNIRIDYHWYLGEVALARAAIAQLLPQTPDVILAVGSPAVMVAQQATRAIPVVFVGVSEPIAQGFVASLAHPGGNISGFTNFWSGAWEQNGSSCSKRSRHMSPASHSCSTRTRPSMRLHFFLRLRRPRRNMPWSLPGLGSIISPTSKPSRRCLHKTEGAV